MRRHDALLPLTHDHHHGLAQARRLKKAADDTPSERLERARGFVRFFESDTLLHFREEEEVLFPLIVEHADPLPEELVEVLRQHVRIHAFVWRLRRQIAAETVDADTLRDTGDLLEAHIRLEERGLFPLIEKMIPDQDLATLQFAERHRGPAEPA